MAKSGGGAGVDPRALVTSSGLRKSLEATLGWKTNVGFFPVRHHSPTGARHLDKWLRRFKPDAVLIEGPHSFNDRIEILSDPEHDAPFCVVAAVRTKGEVLSRSYYPLCDYSPELVALRVARDLKATPVFCDLVHGESAEAPSESSEEGADAVPPVGEEHLGAAEDGPLARSKFTQEIIERSGCRDFDEVWESLFEQAGWEKSPEEWALELAAYSYLSRAPYSRDELEADGTLARERCMAWHIEQAQKKHEKIAVITGAFHTVALRESEKAPPPKPRKDVEIEVFVAPYTFPRLDALLGYASGMSGPAFYQHVWDARKGETPFATAAQRVLVEAVRLARKDGEVVGTADAIAALAFAQSLAGFRGRPHVGRVEVIEAAKSCLVKGDATLVGTRVLAAIAEAMRGKKVGKLGASAGQSPLVVDFNRRLKELRLPLEHGRPQAIELDVFGSELALARSRFFQQLKFLEVEFARHERGPDLVTGEDLHLTIEHWSAQYVPEIEAKLVELSPLGSTIEDVAGATLVKHFLSSEGKAGELALHLTRGLVMGLHKVADRLVPRLASAMFSDDDVLSLLRAGATLRNLIAGRERLEARLVSGLPELTRQAYMQGTLRLERLSSFPPDRLEEVLAALASLLDVAIAEPKLAPSREMLLGHAREAAARAQPPAILGALHGFLLQLGDVNPQLLAKTLNLLSRGRTRIDGVGAYIEGVIAVARQALLGDSPLLGALLEHIRDSEWTDFVASLPSLRRALTRLSPRETESVAETAAKALGISAQEMVAMLGADPETVAKLGEWEKAFVDGEKSWAGS